MKFNLQSYEKIVVKFDFPAYVQMLQEELENNVRNTYLLNRIFFPEQYHIKEWIHNIDVKDFFHYQFNGKRLKRNFCNRTEIDSIHWKPAAIEKIDKYFIFSKMEFDDYTEVRKNYPQAYYLLQPDYLAKLDETLFRQLSGYNKIKENIWQKKLSDSISIELNTEREYHAIFSIVDYKLPRIGLKIGNDYLSIWEMDIRQFFFLNTNSFFFFYLDSNQIQIDDVYNIKNIIPQNDQPVVYHKEGEKKYIITNSSENIERYNKYLEIIFHLSVYYLDIFEKYLIKKLNF